MLEFLGLSKCPKKHDQKIELVVEQTWFQSSPVKIWKTVSKALVIVLKFEVGVPPGKLKNPPNNCMPKRANMKMKRKRRKRRERMDEMAFIKAITRFRREDQYLKTQC